MSDRDIDGLVKRLETRAHWWMTAESAAAIRELQAKLAEWQASQDYAYIGRDGKTVLARDLEDRAEAAEAERDRLRDALGGVILATDNSGLEFATVGMRVAERCEDIARAALATPPKSGT